MPSASAARCLKNLQSGRRSEGGSTITQQLARLMFLNRGKTYRRKLKEMIVAAYLENLYTKQEILEMYLNKVYFGDGLHGVEAAARGYFGKPAAELQVDEAALLAGLIQSPSSYAPTVNLDRAIARRNVVLLTMVSSGAIDAATAERAKAAPVKINNALEIKETFGLYFKEQVRRELVERFGWQRVYQGGLRVYTTIDSDLQKAAEALLEEGLQDIERRPGFKHAKRAAPAAGAPATTEAPAYLQGALVAMDPANGHVKAMVGGRDFGESHFNRAMQAKRQSGSAFKPFVYAAALEAGYSPASLITGLNDPILTVKGAWLPEDEHSTGDEMTMRSALRTSSNRAAVQMLASVGIPKAVGVRREAERRQAAERAVARARRERRDARVADRGVRRVRRRRDRADADPDPSRRGQRRRRALQGRRQVAPRRERSDRVPHGEHARRRHQRRAPAYRARQSGFTLPAAGKTGTTNDYNDAWFVGFTPHLVTGVWVGFDQPQTIVVGRLRRRARRADLGRVHEARDARRQAGLVRASGERRRAQRLPDVRQAAGWRLRQRVGRQPRRPGREALDGLHRVLRARHRADRSSVRSTARRSPIVWPASSARRPAFPSPRTTSGLPPPAAEHVGQRRRTRPSRPPTRQGRQGRGAEEEARLLGTDLRPRR